MSLDYGELRSDSGQNAVKRLLRNAAVGQLGASFNQGFTCCQRCFLCKVADARHDGRLGVIDCGGRSFVGC